MEARRQKRKLINKLGNQGYTVNGDIRVWRLYVIELDDGVGPRADERFSWIYVGETTRDPQDRFEQHKRAPATGTAGSTPPSCAITA